jgi:arylsulfatase A-like enzyme
MRTLAIILLCLALGGKEVYAGNKGPDRPPNILVILVDDMGFSDLGCYGGEIRTPNIDDLAAKGLRYTQFYNTAKCHSSRISLLTGRYAFQAGNTALDRSVTFAEMLRGHGYFTAMVGKWHLNQEPTDFGFDRYFGHLSGATNCFLGDETFRLNGEKYQVPAKGFYTTIANTDYAIRFLSEARKKDQPWLLYVAENAPHAPLQCLEEDFRRYEAIYRAGWDKLRNERFRKQKEMGLFGDSVQLSPRPDYLPAWESLSTERREAEAARMAAYAAMIDRIDQELGRLLTDIENAGELGNTFILFISDNGSSPFERHRGAEYPPWEPESGWRVGTAWAWLSNAPFRNYKQNQFEGGIATPAVLYWPDGVDLPEGSFVDEPLHLVDVFPTLAEITSSSIPGSWPGRTLNPLAGISITPTFRGEALGDRAIYLLFNKDRGIRKGDWKLVSFREHPWELYHIGRDRTEMHDLVDQHPAIVLELEELWYEMAEKTDQAPLERRNVLSPTELEKLHPEWTDYATDGFSNLQQGGKITFIEK